MGASDFVTKDSGERAVFESGMQRDTEDGKPRFDLMLPLGIPYEEQMITRLAALFGRGSVKYDARNWEQANSREEMDRMKSSAFRHFIQWMSGETDEDHAAGFMFNAIAYETTKYKVENPPIDFDAVADEILNTGAADEDFHPLSECGSRGCFKPDGSDGEEIVESGTRTRVIWDWLQRFDLVRIDDDTRWRGPAPISREQFYEITEYPGFKTRPMTSLEIARKHGRPY